MYLRYLSIFLCFFSFSKEKCPDIEGQYLCHENKGELLKLSAHFIEREVKEKSQTGLLTEVDGSEEFYELQDIKVKAKNKYERNYCKNNKLFLEKFENSPSGKEAGYFNKIVIEADLKGFTAQEYDAQIVNGVIGDMTLLFKWTCSSI